MIVKKKQNVDKTTQQWLDMFFVSFSHFALRQIKKNMKIFHEMNVWMMRRKDEIKKGNFLTS